MRSGGLRIRKKLKDRKAALGRRKRRALRLAEKKEWEEKVGRVNSHVWD